MPVQVIHCETGGLNHMSSLAINKTGASIGILVALVVVLNVIPFAISYGKGNKMKQELKRIPNGPPAIAFPIVWPLLYTLLAVALWFFYAQQNASTAPYAWAAFAILCAQLIINWAWVPVFASGKKQTASLMIVVMLMLTLSSFALATKGNVISAALIAPYLGWLVYALNLSMAS
jgi:tryptophan-rich sensory protein